VSKLPPSSIVKPGPGMSKLGPNVSTNQTQGSVQAPSPSFAGAELNAEVYTYFAKPSLDGTAAILYNGDRQYAQVVLTLETAGPVIVGTKQQLYPVTSGKGARLETGVPTKFTISKTNRLWVATGSLNRISVTIQPVPWLEQITGLLASIVGSIAKFFSRGAK
jgi:hypothetical protein